MSRSAIVMVVAGAILLGVAAVVFQHYWPVLALKSTLTKLILLGLAGYGALLTAVMIRRIAEPSLPMPILAWGVAIAWFVFGIIATFKGSAEDNEHRRDRYLNSTEPAKSSTFGKHGTGMGWAIFLTLVGLGMYGVGVGMTYWMGRQTLEAPIVAKTPPGSKQPGLPAGMRPPGEAAKPVMNSVVDASDLKSAIAYASKSMTADSEPGEGSKQLAHWLAARGKWADVAVAKNETSIELVEKDAVAQRGKRLCIAGTLLRIEKQTHDGVELHEARLITAQRDQVELYAVGKTGNLVKRRPAKFCGVITGAEREGRAIVAFAVGMFDTNK